MLSLASVCEIDGSRTCLQSSAEDTQLWEYRNCPGASTMFGQIEVTEQTSRTRINTPPPTATPSISPLFGPQSTVQTTISSRSWANCGANRSPLLVSALQLILL
ncbi:hypothetical protein C7974DRAFT_386024 [Boeremia exigua]|uniref:uncharacterized protein n=1 Tax=Boeremia exigua TaxID=749465 RepID=UPI001E8E1D55|nr:uncharacterized protein C7974DRAFT_386024 [Boeremia exigua]KAH6642733.1 hypothetical protein C7974DRAFT_386024 [Boeremia exigua]